MHAEADQPDHAENEQAEAGGGRDSQPLACAAWSKHQERQQQSRGDLHTDPGDDRRGRRPQPRHGGGAEGERDGQHEHDQRVVVRPSDGEHEHHGVEPHERRRPARRLVQPPRRERDQRDRGEAGGGGERFERPQAAGQPERSDRVAEQGEQGAVGGVLERPAQKRERRVGGGFGGEVRVGVEAVERAHVGERDVAEDVLGEQRRAQGEDHMRQQDRRRERAHRQRARPDEHQRVARAHHDHQDLEAAVGQPQVESRERAREPARPAAAARRHIGRRRAGGARAEQEHRRDHAGQAETPQRDAQRGAPALGLPAARG